MGRKPKEKNGYRVPDNTFLHIEAFMVNDLHLSGNELIIYAAIYGFSQDGTSWFTGSRKYLSGWCQVTEETVTYNLNKLLEKGLIECRAKNVHGITFKDYRAVPFLGVYEKIEHPFEKTEQGDEKTDHDTEIPRPHTIGHTIATNHSHTSTRFKPPTVDEVAAYCQQRGNGIDAQHFIDYYAARGWQYKGGTRMKDWRAAVRTWERNNGGNDTRQQQQGGFDASKYNYL